MENNINFNADENINIVEAKPEDKKSKKLPIIIIICILVIALVTGIIIYATKDNDETSSGIENSSVSEETTTNSAQKDFYDSLIDETLIDENGNVVDRDEYAQQIQQQIQEATTLLNQYVGSESPNVIVENTTSANTQQQEQTTVNEQYKKQALEQIKAFFNRSFYMQGAIYSDSTGNALSMSFDGDNFEALTNLDGVEISVMCVDGVMYFKRPALGQYVEITDSVMEVIGMSPEMLNFDFPVDSYDVMESKLVSIHNVEINNREGICYEYNNAGQVSKFFFDGGDLRQIEIYNADGEVVSQFTIDYFSQSLPADHLTLKGYEKTGFGSLFADILAEG